MSADHQLHAVRSSLRRRASEAAVELAGRLQGPGPIDGHDGRRSGAMPSPDGSVDRDVSALQALVAVTDPAAPLDEVVAALSNLFPAGTEAAVVQSMPDSSGEDVYATGDSARRAAWTQITVGQGPLVDALTTTSSVVFTRHAVSHRWPAYGAATAVASQRDGTAMSIREGKMVFSLEVSGTNGCVATSALAEVLAGVLRTRSRVAVSEARIHHLEIALERRIRVEQAKGMVSALTDLDPEDAFAAIRRCARRESRPIGDVIDDVLTSRRDVQALAAPNGDDASRAHHGSA